MTVETKLASAVDKDIFLDRFQKEIVDRFDFRLKTKEKEKSHKKQDDTSRQDAKDAAKGDAATESTERQRRILKDCICVGLSSCSKALAKESAPIDLLVVASDYDPVHFAAHLPVVAHQRKIPILLLPDASRDLGKVLGVRCAGVIAFSLQGALSGEADRASRTMQEKLTSFVSFVKSTLM